MAGTIGIKTANGDFYPIIEENSTLKKRLILTTAHDRQASVQIDLFRSISRSMLDAQYIGSLAVDNLRPKPKGEPSIEMLIAGDSEGNINADAYDLDAGGEHHSLNISLKTLDSTGLENEFLDFDLERKEPQTPSGLYNRTENEKEDERTFPWFIMGLATLFVIIAVGLIWFFFLGGRDSFRQPMAQRPPLTQQQVPAPQPEAVQQIQPVQITPAESPAPIPVIQAPATPPAPPPGDSTPPETVVRVRPPAPVLSHRVPAVIPRNGVVYQIRWGDTLWDISQAFYRNPWLYPRIARFNNIQDPDFIISGFNVRIPPLD